MYHNTDSSASIQEQLHKALTITIYYATVQPPYFMKQDIHPTYYTDAKVSCACGNTFITGSTMKELHIEICSNCHPFYTGKDKLIDTAGRVDRFKRLVVKKKEISETRKGKKVKRARSQAKKVAKTKKEK